MVSAVFSALGVHSFEERFSSNYPPDDHYFLGFGANASIVLCDADDLDSSDYPFCLSIRPPVAWRAAVDAIPTEAESLASMLRVVGIQSKTQAG
jgi:hypothetical protein